MKKISAIWAQDEQGIIGKDGQLPWNLPAELAHFKRTTTGHIMVMGRQTFEGMQRRVLPNRISVILTRDPNYEVDHERALVMHSVEEILDWYQGQEQILYVIGGSQVLAAFAPYLEEIIRTDIEIKVDGDVYITDQIDWNQFRLVSEQHHAEDVDNSASFTIRIFEKKE